MSNTIAPVQFRWNPEVRPANSSEHDTRLQATQVMDKVDEMRGVFQGLDNSANDLDSAKERVWVKGAALGAGGAQLSGSLDAESGLVAYLGGGSQELPNVQFTRQEMEGATTWVRRSPEAIEHVRQYASGEMEYIFARP